jgi:ribosome biogenesis GTPase / thiamine phosphate phosphatase
MSVEKTAGNEVFAGLVVRSTGSWYEVKTPEKQIFPCRLRGKFKLEGKKVTNPIAVGDHVKFIREEENSSQGIIIEILPRNNYIVRKSVHRKHESHVLAANLDQAVLVVTLVLPRTSLGFIDRFLVTAESFRIPVVVVFNKIDLLGNDGMAYQQELMNLYESIGYACIQTSTVAGINTDVFRQLLHHKKTLLSGHSGVGKSSLINAINPAFNLKTSEVSTFANKGVHTTTFSEMLEIEEDTYIIDSPGIKELGLSDIDKSEISHYFPEMRDLLNLCKYHNCSHLHEPGCAVIAAVEAGTIAESRYINYLSMFEDNDNRR